MTTNKPELRPCPSCGGLSRRTLYQQRFHEGILGEGYDVVICEGCGMGFADNIPTQAELDSYYAELSKYAYAFSENAESVYDLQRFDVIYEQVKSLFPSTEGRILDIGCATGGLLSVFKKQGYSRLYGADPSPACASLAKQRHGLDVRVSTLAQLAVEKEKYDLILLVGVLEHLRDVREALQILKKLLNPGALLYVAVPDVTGFSECRNAPFQQFSMEHLNFFSSRSLDRVMSAGGFGSIKSWRHRLEWRQGIWEPIVAGLYRGSEPGTLTPDPLTEPALKQYISWSRGKDVRLAEIISELVQTQEPVLVWGAGALTRRLLATTLLASANILAFVDSNVQRQREGLLGKKIFSPAQLLDRRECILVSSVAFEEEIVQMIRDQLKLKNRLIMLGG